ncbi:unannotated protein [freshwater metagenome]|uniref:Unannotated protein n=1 Tax=freshwater metagenome TaxID=449393 RepID=A0A6J7FJ16_9ZZZZ|nr:hypothetical protein [Actinomycetota bacterium]MSY79858.1 hypothetical protein [Actinomycetota bacterium]MTA62897.1 hypothetical protein [Actinomycetota bacterium]
MSIQIQHSSQPKPKLRTAVAASAFFLATLLLAACVPPVSPGPTVRPQPAGRGKVTSVDVAPSAGCSSSAARPPTGRSVLSVATAHGTRNALIDLPASAAGPEPLPVLISLHPFTLNGRVWDQYSQLAAAGTARNYIVVTALGSEPGPRWAVPGGLEYGVDDLGYLSAALDTVEDSLCVNRNREFAAGFSAGAAMAQALSCTMPWRMAGIAASGGSNLTDLCPNSAGTDTMILHGSADPIAPLSGSQVAFAPPAGLSVDSVVATNAARSSCNPDPVSEQLFPSVIVDSYEGCTENRRVQYWRMIGAGHTWAGANTLVEFVTGPTNTEISASERVLDFFDAHTA